MLTLNKFVADCIIPACQGNDKYLELLKNNQKIWHSDTNVWTNK